MMNKNWQHLLNNLQQLNKTLPQPLSNLDKFALGLNSYSDEILPFDLYRNTRSNLEKIGDQINQAYFFGVFDGCAVLMRRMIEMLLILSFKNYGIESEIKDSDGNYFQISALAKQAQNSSTLDLSRNCKKNLDQLIEKGHLSAHNPFYNARQKDIDLEQFKFRQVIEELFHKAGIL